MACGPAPTAVPPGVKVQAYVTPVPVEPPVNVQRKPEHDLAMVGTGALPPLSPSSGPLPIDPTDGKTYWYTTDGDAFILYAGLESPPDGQGCPLAKPEFLARETNLICVQSSPPGP